MSTLKILNSKAVKKFEEYWKQKKLAPWYKNGLILNSEIKKYKKFWAGVENVKCTVYILQMWDMKNRLFFKLFGKHIKKLLEDL